MLNPPISPAVALIIPDIVTLPSGVKWKFDELISMLSKAPLTNWPAPPKKKAEDET